MFDFYLAGVKLVFAISNLLILFGLGTIIIHATRCFIDDTLRSEYHIGIPKWATSCHMLYLIFLEYGVVEDKREYAKMSMQDKFRWEVLCTTTFYSSFTASILALLWPVVTTILIVYNGVLYLREQRRKEKERL